MHVLFGALIEKALEVMSDFHLRGSRRAYEAYKIAWDSRETAPDEVELSLLFEQWSTPVHQLDPDAPELAGWFEAWNWKLPPRAARRHAKRS